ncbi:hypothetical protein AD998_08025 [bacterium 336/3]|nr:hypothetical protein AD998_08025 [bacterium 336/3]
MKNKIIIWMLGMIFFSCQKEIDLNLNSANSKIVIEGEILQNETAQVKISKTVDVDDANSYPAVSGAIVIIKDDLGNTEQLLETASGVYETSLLKGTEGRTYTLEVTVENNVYSAQSTMPQKVNLDDVKISISTFSPPGQTEDNYIVYPQFIDPLELGNNYRFIQSKNGEADPTIIVANDNIDNGVANSRPIFSQDFELKKGDTLTLEMMCIDKATYDYFFSLNQSQGNGPGGGTTPANPVSNIQGGALGYFSAYTSQKKIVLVN